MRSALRSVAAAAATFASVASAGGSTGFDQYASDNVAVYWGQGANQGPLRDTCDVEAVSIVNIAFVHIFPDQEGSTGYPGTNFGNACGLPYAVFNGVESKFLANCPQIGADIVYCQSKGKKVLLSLGGGANPTYYVSSAQAAADFATFLWKAFGPKQSGDDTPRPFGNAVIDGFDFDIETIRSSAPVDAEGKTIDDYESRGYDVMANYLKAVLFPEDASKDYYLSAAPQCVVPDAHLDTAIKNAWFDWLFIQFYNTAQCSARAGYEHITAGGSNDISYNAWAGVAALNPWIKLYIGLPAAPAAAAEGYYLSPPEAAVVLDKYKSDTKFGGVSLWEATYSKNNTKCGKDYATWIKAILKGSDASDYQSCGSSSTSSALPSASHAVSIDVSATRRPHASSTLSHAVKASASASATGKPHGHGGHGWGDDDDDEDDWHHGHDGDDDDEDDYEDEDGHWHHPSGPDHAHKPSSRPPYPISSGVWGHSTRPSAPLSTGTHGGHGHHWGGDDDDDDDDSHHHPGHGDDNDDDDDDDEDCDDEDEEGSGSHPHPSGSYISSAPVPVSTPYGGHGGHHGQSGYHSQSGKPSHSHGGHYDSSAPTPTKGPEYPGKPSNTPEGPETVTTVITTEYVDICPTGFTTVTVTYTTTYCPETEKAGPTGVPSGWTTTETVCTVCGAAPTTVTLTKPVDSYPTGGSGSGSGSGGEGIKTIYSTKQVTVTKCPEGTPNCPADQQTTKVVETKVPVATTTKEVAGGKGSEAKPTASTIVVSKVVVTPVPSVPGQSYGGSGGYGSGEKKSNGTGTAYPTGGSKTTPGLTQFTGAASRVGQTFGLGVVGLVAAMML